MNKNSFLLLCFILFIVSLNYSQTKVVSEESREPVSYATISFNNGYGTFADDEGKFIFTNKLYPGIDSLTISALGFKDFSVRTDSIPKLIELKAEPSELEAVWLDVQLDRQFEEETLKPYLDDNYYKSWLPTIESEIAVFFNNEGDELKKISKVHFPLMLESVDWEKRNKRNSKKKKFSTLFKVKFYENEDGQPGKELTKETIVFRATEKMGDEFILDVSAQSIFFPKDGFYVSIQVLGYTDKNGKLLANKKYKEIKTGSGVVRIPTNFRPLLPFTDEIDEDRTFVKRVFINGNKWVKFNLSNVPDSNLTKSGLNNYGIGITYKVYEDE